MTIQIFMYLTFQYYFCPENCKRKRSSSNY